MKSNARKPAIILLLRPFGAVPYANRFAKRTTARFYRVREDGHGIFDHGKLDAVEDYVFDNPLCGLSYLQISTQFWGDTKAGERATTHFEFGELLYPKPDVVRQALRWYDRAIAKMAKMDAAYGRVPGIEHGNYVARIMQAVGCKRAYLAPNGTDPTDDPRIETYLGLDEVRCWYARQLNALDREFPQEPAAA